MLHYHGESYLSVSSNTEDTDERNKIEKEEKHFRNQCTRPLRNQPIQTDSQSAPTEMPMGQTTVKPFAISDFDSPTFFQWRDKDEDGSVIQGKGRSCSIYRSVLKFADGQKWRKAWWSAGTVAENDSGGGFKETAVMLRRQLEEKGFSTMRECVWARFSGETRALPIRSGFFLLLFLYCLLLQIYSNDTRRAGELLGNGRSKPKSMV